MTEQFEVEDSTYRLNTILGDTRDVSEDIRYEAGTDLHTIQKLYLAAELLDEAVSKLKDAHTQLHSSIDLVQ